MASSPLTFHLISRVILTILRIQKRLPNFQARTVHGEQYCAARTDLGLGACNHPVTWTFAAVFLLVARSAFAQEQEKPPARSVSPDGQCEFRTGAVGEQADFVIAKAGSDETSLVLSEEEYTDGL